MILLHQLSEGDTIKVRSGFGNGPIHVGTVLGVCEDIKNGLPGVDYSMEGDTNGFSHWCYLDQVLAVTNKAGC